MRAKIMKAPAFANLCVAVCMLSAFTFVCRTCATERAGRQTELSKPSSTIEPVDRSIEGTKAFADLATFYENNHKTPPYSDSLAQLDAPGASGEAAARYVLALCKQSIADETNGRCHWQATPFWGEGARSPAHEFRKNLITDFCASACGDRALDIALWLVNNDQSSTVPGETLAVFKRGTGAHCVDVYRKLLEQPYSLAELRPEIESLENHYRQSVRNAARRAAQDLGLKTASEFVPETAFTPWLERQLHDINEMVYGTIPPGSQFSRVVLQSKQGDQNYSEELAGWVLKDTTDNVEVLDTFGRHVKYPKHPPVSLFPSIESIFGKTDATWVTSVTPYQLKLAATDLVAVRAQLVGQRVEGIEASNRRSEAEAKLSIRGGLTGQFENRSISVPEALVATWCYLRGDKASTARLLFPCIDNMSDDRELATAMRNTLGTTYYHEMLDHFSLSRDYSGTLALAAHLLKPQFNGAFYQEQVCELSSQLKGRSSDFNSFCLPEPSQWRQMKEKMSTQEKIDFLATRLRLLNCRQRTQPGIVDFGVPQFKEAIQHSESASKITILGLPWQPGINGTEVINPYVELFSIMQNHDNIPRLLPYLKDKNYVVAVGYWRDFHPARRLTRVNELVAGLINYSAGGTIVDPEKFESLSSAQQESYLQDVLRWCKTHQNQSKQDLALETARTTKDRNEFRAVIDTLIKDRDTRVLEVFDARYNQFDGLVLPDIAQAIFSLDSPETKAYARKWLARPFPKKPNQTPDNPTLRTIVCSLPAENPIAAQAGLRVGDQIVAINHLKVTDSSDVVKKVVCHKNELIKIDILRRGEPLTFTMKTNAEGKVGMGLSEHKESVDTAKRQNEMYRWSGELGIRFWSSILLLKSDSKDQDLAINGLRKLVDTIGLGRNPIDIELFKEGYYPFLYDKPAVKQMFKVRRKDAHDLACCLGKMPYSNGWPGALPLLRLLFNAGCPDALRTLTAYLRLPLTKDAPYGEQLVNGKAVKYRDAPGDYLVEKLVGHQYCYTNESGPSETYAYPDWAPPGFTFERTEPEETKQQKREQLAQYLEKKFQDIRDGKSPPLSIAD